MRCTAAKLSNNIGRNRDVTVQTGLLICFLARETREAPTQPPKSFYLIRFFVSSSIHLGCWRSMMHFGEISCARFFCGIGMLLFTAHRMYLSVCHGWERGMGIVCVINDTLRLQRYFLTSCTHEHRILTCQQLIWDELRIDLPFSMCLCRPNANIQNSNVIPAWKP